MLFAQHNNGPPRPQSRREQPATEQPIRTRILGGLKTVGGTSGVFQALVPETAHKTATKTPGPKHETPASRRGFVHMELGGLEPPTSWERCRKTARQKLPICRGFRGAPQVGAGVDCRGFPAILGVPGTGKSQCLKGQCLTPDVAARFLYSASEPALPAASPDRRRLGAIRRLRPYCSLRASVSINQRAKTLVHELSHMLLRCGSTWRGPTGSAWIRCSMPCCRGVVGRRPLLTPRRSLRCPRGPRFERCAGGTPGSVAMHVSVRCVVLGGGWAENVVPRCSPNCRPDGATEDAENSGADTRRQASELITAVILRTSLAAVRWWIT